MFKDISFGQYYPTNSIIHRLDPRAKIIMNFLFVVGIFLINSYFGFMLATAIILAVILMAKLPILSVLKSLKGILFIILLTSVLNIFFYTQKADLRILAQLKGATISVEGVDQALKIFLRLVLAITGASLFSLTTTPVEVANGIEGLLKPLRIIKVPVRDLAMIISIALRFVPTIFEEVNMIMSAQKSRGASIDTGNFFKRIKALPPILIPLFVNSFKRADELAYAMESRCYGASKKTVKLHKNKLKVLDYLAVIFIIAFLVFVCIDRWLPNKKWDMDAMMKIKGIFDQFVISGGAK